MTVESELNPFSQRFAERLFTAHPEWRSSARRDPHGFPDPGSLLLVVQSPVAGRPLTIRTYGNQVTIDFGPHGWHEHFLGATPADERKATDDAIALIDALMGDRQMLVTRTLLGRIRWTRVMPASGVRRPRFGRTEIISWSGRQDKAP